MTICLIWGVILLSSFVAGYGIQAGKVWLIILGCLVNFATATALVAFLSRGDMTIPGVIMMIWLPLALMSGFAALAGVWCVPFSEPKTQN